MTDRSAEPAPLSVLLVEDMLDEALLIRTLLEDRLGASVTLVQDGDHGCDLVRAREWDLVIADLNLPGKSGEEVIRASKEAFPGQPVLAVTGYSNGGSRARDAGADDVFLKPLDRDRLLEAVRSLVGGRREEQEEAPGEGRRILALGALPGDVELGCGGILLSHRDRGHRVELLVMSAGGKAAGVADRKQEARRAAVLMDAELRLGRPFGHGIPDQDEMNAWTEEAIRRFRPDTLYTPSLSDVRESRFRTCTAALETGSAVRRHYCYQAATTSLEFRPTFLVDVEEQMEQKLELLKEYRAEPDFRPHLQTNVAYSSAEYWGRFLGYRLAEPLEVERSRS